MPPSLSPAPATASKASPLTTAHPPSPVALHSTEPRPLTQKRAVFQQNIQPPRHYEVARGKFFYEKAGVGFFQNIALRIQSVIFPRGVSSMLQKKQATIEKQLEQIGNNSLLLYHLAAHSREVGYNITQRATELKEKCNQLKEKPKQLLEELLTLESHIKWATEFRAHVFPYETKWCSLPSSNTEDLLLHKKRIQTLCKQNTNPVVEQHSCHPQNSSQTKVKENSVNNTSVPHKRGSSQPTEKNFPTSTINSTTVESLETDNSIDNILSNLSKLSGENLNVNHEPDQIQKLQNDLMVNVKAIRTLTSRKNTHPKIYPIGGRYNFEAENQIKSYGQKWEKIAVTKDINNSQTDIKNLQDALAQSKALVEFLEPPQKEINNRLNKINLLIAEVKQFNPEQFTGIDQIETQLALWANPKKMDDKEQAYRHSQLWIETLQKVVDNNRLGILSRIRTIFYDKPDGSKDERIVGIEAQPISEETIKSSINHLTIKLSEGHLLMKTLLDDLNIRAIAKSSQLDELDKAFNEIEKEIADQQERLRNCLIDKQEFASINQELLSANQLAAKIQSLIGEIHLLFPTKGKLEKFLSTSASSVSLLEDLKYIIKGYFPGKVTTEAEAGKPYTNIRPFNTPEQLAD